MAAYETIKTISDDKYEYILPEMVLSKNLLVTIFWKFRFSVKFKKITKQIN